MADTGKAKAANDSLGNRCSVEARGLCLTFCRLLYGSSVPTVRLKWMMP